MFQELVVTLQGNISTIRSIIKTNEKLRDIAFGSGDNKKQKTSQEYSELLITLKKEIPGVREWRIYDHCAVVTRLYAIYERFFENLISDWLILLPELFTNYSDLDERIRNTHQVGVGRLLLELKKNRYEHLSIEEVVRGLFRGVTGEEKYQLLPDAFLFHEQNLRREILEKLLADAGIPNTWAWLDKHRTVNNFVVEIRGNQNTAEGELNELISYRNDAAHGALIDDFLSSNALLELCDFVEALCQALAELVAYQVIERKKSIGLAREIGRITEWFKKPTAAVAKVDKTTLSVGGSIFLVGEACCQLATIQSIQIDNIPNNQVQATTEMEVGLKFDVNAKKDLRLYQLES